MEFLSISIAIWNTCASNIQTSLMAQCFVVRPLSLLGRPGCLAQHTKKPSFMFSRFWDIIIVASDHLQSTKGGFWGQVHNLYLRRCWRWIRKPDSQNDSSQKGASTPDSTFSWTAEERKEQGKRKHVINYHCGKPGEIAFHGKTQTQPGLVCFCCCCWQSKISGGPF